MTAYNEFRVRRGWFGTSILQQLKSYPTFNGGSVDSSVREWQWVDVNYDRAPTKFVLPTEKSEDE